MKQDTLFSVADQVVLLSGASRGIGQALAKGFAERDAQVIITGREAKTIEQTARDISVGAKPARSIVCDVTDEKSLQSTVDQVIAEFGRIDTLVNVAGMNKRMKVENYTAAIYDEIIDTNLRGMFLLTQMVGKHMIARGRGNIISIDSLNTYAPLKGVTPYAMSKGGVSMMTRGMATEWGAHGVRVNAIAPGFFPTALSKKMWAIPKMLDWVTSVTPLKKLGEVEELVGTAVFLASDAAKFVTGQVIRVDGGISAGILWPLDLD
jgi:gluconate 5-dehydrogenase